MKSSLSILMFLILFYQNSSAQKNVGIGTQSPNSSAVLELQANDKGLLIPRVNLVSITDILTIPSPVVSLLVYNTNTAITGGNGEGFYYWDGTQWSQVKGSAYTPGCTTTNFLTKSTGTQDTCSIVYDDKTNVGIGTITPTHKFHVLQTGTNSAGRFENSNAAGDALVGLNTATPGSGVGAGVFGSSDQTGGGSAGVRGESRHSAGIGVLGFNLAATDTNIGPGVYGGTAQSKGAGVFGSNSNSNGYGMIGRNNVASGSNKGGGIFGITSQSGGHGVRGFNSAALGNGVGAGVFGSSYQIAGIWGLNHGTSGTGIVAAGNNNTIAGLLASGSGISATGDLVGVYGLAVSTSTTGTQPRAGGYFATGSIGTTSTTTSYAYVGLMQASSGTGNGTTPRKIVGNGTVNTIVDDMDGNPVLLSAPEAPENLFEDYGVGKLKDGKTHITLDPVFIKNTVVNEEHPLRVFVQLEGACNGVYVTNKSPNGFDVVELMGGTSNTDFMWHIIANRADQISPDGTPFLFADERFAPAPKAMETKQIVASEFDNAILEKLPTIDSRGYNNEH